MTNDLTKDAIIIGAGITGLATAHFLKTQGVSTYVLEKDPHVGGTIRSGRVDGFLVEYGPNSALDTSPVLHELFESAGVADRLEYANNKSQNRYIVRGGRLVNLPMSPVAFLKTPLFSTSAKLRLLKEPFISRSNPDTEESLADFVRRRIGDEFLDYAINPFVAGVYAGDPEELSVKSSFPKLFELEQKHGSLIKGAIAVTNQFFHLRKKLGIGPATIKQCDLMATCQGPAYDVWTNKTCSTQHQYFQFFPVFCVCKARCHHKSRSSHHKTQ